MKLFDVHTHVQFAAFRDDANRQSHEYKEGIYATVGLHPIHTSRSYHDEKEVGAASEGGEPRLEVFWARREEFDYNEYKKLALDEKVIAIGEGGLDYYRLLEDTKKKKEKNFFK